MLSCILMNLVRVECQRLMRLKPATETDFYILLAGHWRVLMSKVRTYMPYI